MADTPQSYGRYNIASAALQLLPQFDPDPKSGSSVRLVTPPGTKTVLLNDVETEPRWLTFDNAFRPTTKRAAVGAAQPQTPSISGVGVMDIGQGNCNLLIGQAPTGEPADVLAYYDTGYPLWFYVSTLPNTMRFGNAQYQGPITNNQNGNLCVVLSHWDWDHWRLGRIAQLNNLPWTVPNQPMGPAAANFLATIANANTVNANTPPFNGPANSTIYCCRPPQPAQIAALINNTGLAMTFPAPVIANSTAQYEVVLTGDANFNSVTLPPTVQIGGIVAVHHGSNAHGAAQNLPDQADDLVFGQIAYSYGVGPNNGNHAYNFPVPTAVNAYVAAGWSSARSTAEGQNINQHGQAGRGNVRMGANVPLLAAYQHTAFALFPNQLT